MIKTAKTRELNEEVTCSNRTSTETSLNEGNTRNYQHLLKRVFILKRQTMDERIKHLQIGCALG